MMAYTAFMEETTVISLGGSIVAPAAVDISFLKSFFSFLREYLCSSENRRLILVVGGGAPARDYQKAYREAAEEYVNADADCWHCSYKLNAEPKGSWESSASTRCY